MPLIQPQTSVDRVGADTRSESTPTLQTAKNGSDASKRVEEPFVDKIARKTGDDKAASNHAGERAVKPEPRAKSSQEAAQESAAKFKKQIEAGLIKVKEPRKKEKRDESSLVIGAVQAPVVQKTDKKEVKRERAVAPLKAKAGKERAPKTGTLSIGVARPESVDLNKTPVAGKTDASGALPSEKRGSASSKLKETGSDFVTKFAVSVKSKKERAGEEEGQTATGKEKKVELKLDASVPSRDPITLVVDRRTGDKTAASSPAPHASGAESSLRSLLAATGNDEIVKSARVVMRSGDMGEISLTLKPESLGTVRIKLSMEDNRLLGRIIVESFSVKQAFDDNLADLRDRFLNAGYQNAELQVSVGLSGSSQRDAQNGGESERSGFLSARLREGSAAFESSGLERVVYDEYRGRVDVRA